MRLFGKKQRKRQERIAVDGDELNQHILTAYKNGLDEMSAHFEEMASQVQRDSARTGFELCKRSVITLICKYQQQSYAKIEEDKAGVEIDSEAQEWACTVLDAVIDAVSELDSGHIRFPGDAGHPDTENPAEEDENDE